MELFPFDFNEYLLARPNGDVFDYLKDGGFPRALSYHDPEILLREYFTDIIERDVRRHVAVRSASVLTRLAKSVFESMGSEVSQRSLAGMLGVTADTIGTYLSACESAYLILACPYFTFSERQRTARHRKFYPVDLGLRAAIATRTGSDVGKNLEGAVFLHLRRRHSEVFYWRGQGEVDFVVQDRNGITPYQVSLGGLKPRHERALDEFRKKFPQTNPPVIVSEKNIRDFLSE
jgi:predicted AAA+ superfamily ATPase